MPSAGWAAFSRRFTYGTSAGNAIVLAVVALLFAACAAWVLIAITRTELRQSDVRRAQEARRAVIALAYDQTLALRNYVDTRDPAFRDDFARAAAAYPHAVTSLRSEAAEVDKAALLPPIDDARARHARWESEVAAPLVRDAARGRSARTAAAEKDYVAAIFADDGRLDAALTADLSAADRVLLSGLVPDLVLTAFIVLLFLGGMLYYGARHATMSRRLESETQRAVAEMMALERLQQAFVQYQLPSFSNVAFSATYLPAGNEAKIGGDWYDAFELPDGRILFSIGDVAGHGVEAAVTMSRARQSIIAAALLETDPGKVLTHSNAVFMLQETKFATAICGYVDPRTLDVVYATAGHPPAILVDDIEGARTIDFGGLPLGVDKDAAYPTFSFAARHNSLLVLYTDGLLEYDRDLLEGERRILAAVNDVAIRRHDNPAIAIQDAIFASYTANDDVAIMTISFSNQRVDEDPAAPNDDSEPRWAVGFRGVRAPLPTARAEDVRS